MNGATRVQIETLAAGVAEARVGFQVLGVDASSIIGAVNGPHCRFTRTLPATYSVRDGVVTIPDPCYWSPSLPHRYRVQLTGRALDGQPIALEDTFSLRRLTAGRRTLALDGRAFVVRAWRLPAARSIDQIEWEALREHGLSLWIDSAEPTDDLSAVLEAAEERGVFVAGDATAGRHACALAVPPERRLSLPIASDTVAAASTPCFAVRVDASVATAAEARRACERLQADCAPHTDLAGYVV